MPKIEVKDGADETTILLDGDSGDIIAGDHGKIGDIVLKDQQGKERIRIGRITETGLGTGDSQNIPAQYYGIRVRTPEGVDTIEIGWRTAQQSIDGSSSDMLLAIGGAGAPGTLVLRDQDGKQVMRLDGSDGTAKVGGSGEKGELVIQDGTGKSVRLTVAGDDQLVLVGPSGANRLLLDAARGDVWVGGKGAGGDLVVLPSTATATETDQSTIHLDGDGATLRLGLKGKAGGKIIIRDAFNGVDAFRLESPFGAHMFAGTEGLAGFVHVVNSEGKDGVFLDGGGMVKLGSNQGLSGILEVYDDAGNDRITLDGNTGDIRLRGADCAEQFEITDAQQIEPGSVVVLNPDGKLHLCETAYDKRVIGVVSGAGGLSPGIILGNTRNPGQRSPIAMTGMVYCKVDARPAPIEPGDLLTTSATAGHAMKAVDGAQSHGTVIGKALAGLAGGCSALPIVVMLG